MNSYLSSTFLVFLIHLSLTIFGQQTDSTSNSNLNTLKYEDFIYKPNIHSALLYKEGWELSYPVIDMNSPTPLVLHFDDLDPEIKDYSYTFLHCNSDWQPSSLMQADYLDGFAENKIYNYTSSFNTTTTYTHYNISFPNNDVKLKVSGNYIIKVFNNFDPNDIVLTKRFYVVDSKVSVTANVKQAVLSDFRKSGHQVDFEINKQFYSISDSYNDIKVVLMQNYRQDNVISTLKPQFVNGENLVYNFNEDNFFMAGGEYRYFDMKTLRLNAERVDQITYVNGAFHVKLLDDERRTFKTYIYHKDINGKYLVKSQDGQSNDTEADYAFVYFSLPYDAPVIKGDIYVCGALSDWNFSKNNKMKYNFERKQYELVLLLKQGYYNYQYFFLKDGDTKGDVATVEGSHFETENDYLIFVYHKDISSRYDKLIGFQIANSVIKNK